MEVLKEAEKDLAGPNKKYDICMSISIYIYIYSCLLHSCNCIYNYMYMYNYIFIIISVTIYINIFMYNYSNRLSNQKQSGFESRKPLDQGMPYPPIDSFQSADFPYISKARI